MLKPGEASITESTEEAIRSQKPLTTKAALRTHCPVRRTKHGHKKPKKEKQKN